MTLQFVMKSTHHPRRSHWSAFGKTLSAAGVLLLFLAGCTGDPAPERADAARPGLSATDVARVGNVVISRRAFEEEWKRRADARSKEDLLQEMIRFESLLAKARAAGVDRDPEVVAAFNRMVVGKFQETQLQARGLESIQLSEVEVQAYYRRHLDRFTTPRQIRAAVIFCKANSKATAEKREELRQRADALWSQARQADDQAFRQLALQHSDDQVTRYAGGDTGWFNPEQTDSPREREVIQAALALSDPGNLAPLIETANGFYIVKLLGAQPASHRPLEQVREAIQYQLRMEKAHEIRQTFFKEMQADLTIEVNRAALDAVPDRVMQAETSPPPSLPK